MLSPLSKYVGFYQELLTGTVNFLQLASRLIQLGEQAHLVRQFDKVREVGLLLSNIPVKRYQAIGHYFLAVASSCGGNGDQDNAERLFQLVVDTAPDTYRAKALVSLGTLAIRKNDLASASRHFQETIRAERLGPMSLQALRGMSILKSIEGFHRSAITDVERILPLIDTAPLRVRLDCLNSYAVELSEVGRLQEAESVSLIVTASPLAHYDPRWQETLSDIRTKQKRRSTVTISRPLIEQEDEAEAEPDAPRNVLRTARVQTVMDFLNANIERKITLSEMAALINLSPNHFCRMFKAETGLAPVQYLTKLRIEKAGHLLTTSFLSIKQVMATVGYDVRSRANFTIQFKRHFGLTPTQYRKQSRSIVSLSGLQTQIETTEPVSNVVQFPTSKRLADLRALLESTESSGLSLTPLQLLTVILKLVLKERITDAEIEKICSVYYDTVTKWYPLDWPFGK